MENFDVYKDIELRTRGDIYIGVVGPVRSGKSTFVSKFMENVVIPNIKDANDKRVAVDELPLSGGGKTIMTTEPKFVPGEAVRVSIEKSGLANLRLIDCVGYMVDGSLGREENGVMRLVKTPWQDEEMPFDEAAEFGTRKVIRDHSTIGIVVTTDGSFTDLPRDGYRRAEERVIAELKEIGKPFAIFLNVKDEKDAAAVKLSEELTDKYGVPVVLSNALTLNKDKIDEILKAVLFEFPVRRIDVELPDWMRCLPSDSSIIKSLLSGVSSQLPFIHKMRDYEVIEALFTSLDDYKNECSTSLMLCEGTIKFSAEPADGVFFKTLSEQAEEQLEGEFALMKYVVGLKQAKKSYYKLKGALESAESTGYGVVEPLEDEITLSEPEMVKTGNRFGIRIKANAPSLHIIKVDIDAEVNSVVGREQQCKEYVDYLKSEYSACPASIMKIDLFGRPLYSFVSEEILDKAGGMRDSFRSKIQKTVSKIVNEKKTALFCLTV